MEKQPNIKSGGTETTTKEREPYTLKEHRKGEEQETDFFEPCIIKNVSQKHICIMTIASSWGSNATNQTHTFCSHGLCQQNLFMELQSYTGVLGTLLFILKLPFRALRTDPRTFAPPAWNAHHLEEQEYFKNNKF